MDQLDLFGKTNPPFHAVMTLHQQKVFKIERQIKGLFKKLHEIQTEMKLENDFFSEYFEKLWEDDLANLTNK